jgi:hypothetical protein
MSDGSGGSGELLSTGKLCEFPGYELARAETSPGTSVSKRYPSRPQRTSALRTNAVQVEEEAEQQAAEVAVVQRKRSGSGYQAGVTFPNPRGLACSFCGAKVRGFELKWERLRSLFCLNGFLYLYIHEL